VPESRRIAQQLLAESGRPDVDVTALDGAGLQRLVPSARVSIGFHANFSSLAAANLVLLHGHFV